MNIHEYQAKRLLKEYGAPVADGRAVYKAIDAEAAAKELPGPLYVVKAQIHAGGRGKGKFKEAAAEKRRCSSCENTGGSSGICDPNAWQYAGDETNRRRWQASKPYLYRRRCGH